MLLALLPILFAGCQGVGEKEAQLEFERLRRGPSVPRNRILPDFGNEPPSSETRLPRTGAPHL